ncbi:MAG TPA: hypothetical protein VG188_13280 [Solirubrobacteraceae bacterium]|nr:hypothetical protein [Solirubrobacteraceae bacterium]
MRTPQRAARRTDYMLPAARGEEAMLGARDQLGSVLKRDRVSRLHARPLVEHLGAREAAMSTALLGSENPVADAKIAHGPGPPIGHQHGRDTPYAIGAPMAAPPVRIDRPAKRHARALGHAVEHGSGANLVEACLEGLGRVETPYDGFVTVSGQTPLLLGLQREVAPTHEHMFA